MPQKFEKPFWKTLDGKEFASLKEAEAHESTNYSILLFNRPRADIEAALALDPAQEALTAAIERAANEIKRNRRAKAEAPPSVEPPPAPAGDAPLDP